MAEELLKIEHLTKKFEDNMILDDVSLTVHRGEVIVVVGPSGCGKSTMLRCINALEPIQGGTIEIDGQQISQKSKNLTGKEKPLFGNMRSIGIIPEYRNRRLSNYLVEQCLQWLIEKTEADIVIGVCWKPGGKVPMEKTLKRYEFSHLADVRRLWYDRVDLICPVCRGRCECDAAIYYKRLERNVAQ